MTNISREASTHTDEENRYSLIICLALGEVPGWKCTLFRSSSVISAKTPLHEQIGPARTRGIDSYFLSRVFFKGLFELLFKMRDPYEDNDPFSLS